MKKGGDRLKERKFAYIFVAVLAGVLLIGTAVLAAWNASEYAINFLSMSSFKVSIQEEYQRPEQVDPGQKVTKKVSIKKSRGCRFFCPCKDTTGIWQNG